MYPCSKNHNLRYKLLFENFVNKSCILCDGLQLLCCKFCSNPFSSWWKNGTKLGNNKKISYLRQLLSYEIFLFFPNFVPFFHQDENGLKQNLQHESCIPSQSLQLWFTKFSQKRLVSQVMSFGTRVPKTFNLEKFCPSLGRILTHLLSHFSHSSTWSFKLHFKDGL